MSGAPQPTRPFADHVADYALAGWPCILPVPAADKYPPPVGFTGAAGRDTEPMQLVLWAGETPGHSIALRMPENVIGIDVDEYVKGEKAKHGLATLRAAEQRWGQLPATWCSTARGTSAGPGPSRILFFRVPAQRYATKLGPDVEVIQRHHRYAVVWPSPHPGANNGAGGTYTWYDPMGQPSPLPPKPEELTELPSAWVAGLAEGATQAGPEAADPAAGYTLLEQLHADDRPECVEITDAKLRAYGELERCDEGSRHDTMTERVHHLVQLAAAGHTGVGGVLEQLRLTWQRITAGEDRDDEFVRAVVTSARKAVTAYGPAQVAWDPCTLAQGFSVAAPAPGDDRPTDPDAPEGEDGLAGPIQPERWWSVREAIGVHAFDPRADTDQLLGEAVLERMWPALRYAFDADRWLLRLPQRWELRSGDLANWAVAQVATLMPHGDSSAGKDTDDAARAARRARLLSAKGAGAVAGKMKSLLVGGTHPVALALADLDAEPEILWAGGIAWDLRRCADELVPAPIDPAAPHLHSAAVLPELRPTPLWDAFLEAVWPDEELRSWAVRVLSVALTGYADRALPILLGETGRGKTQVVTLLMSVLGSYAHAANPKLLSAQANSHDTIVHELKGRRLSFIDEGPRDAKAGQERLKQITGGGELTANKMHKDPITFRPTHTLVLTANDEPVLTDPAVRARARLIPCEGDPDLVSATRAALGNITGATWRQEAPGVLAAMMREAAGWLAKPHTASTALAPATIRYRAEELAAEQDPVRTWIDEETEPFDTGTPSRSLYQAFYASCRQSGIRIDAIPSETAWGRYLTRLGYPSVHTMTGKRRQLRIRPAGWVHDGFAPGNDGSMTGSQETRHGVSAGQPPFSFSNDGLTGSDIGIAHDARAHTHAGGAQTENPSNPSEPVSEPKALTPAKQRAAEARAEKLRQAIADAAGPVLELPALVLRPMAGQLPALRPVQLLDADQLLATLDEITVDVEHTAYPIGHADYELRTIQLGTEAFAFVFDAGDPEQVDVVRRHLQRVPVLHAHSATADLVPLDHAGILDADAGWAKMHDTVIPAKLVDPASTGSDPSLKKLAAAVLREHAVSPTADDARAALFKAGRWLTEVKVTTPVVRSGWAQVDPRSTTMIRYAASDVLDDAALARQLPALHPVLLERERTAQRMTARVAHQGLRIDGGHVQALLKQHLPARASWVERVRELSGGTIDNPGSNHQVGAALEALGAHLPRTATGRASVAEGVLEPFRAIEGPIGQLAGAVLEYRHHDTAIGTFLEPYDHLVRYGDGRARPTVYTLGADTGRMSCVRPNLQQVPREGGFRACITADPGELLISADFAGVELRVAAALSQDPNLIAMLDQGVDLHWEAARQVFGPQATKADRYQVKRGVFGWLYGGRAPTLAKQMGVTEQTAQALIDTLGHLLPGVTEWARLTKQGVESGRTQFQAYSGRIVHMPTKAPHAGPNYCIQGTAREVLIDALMAWEQTPWGSAVLLPVHDEIVVRVPEDQAEQATAALVEVMQTELAGVPILAEASTPSFAWADSA